MRILALALSCIVLVSQSALAWNGRGHMIVAAVAWQHMTSVARTRAGELLKLNPLYKSWIKGVPAKDRAKIAFVIAATWPDIIKHARGYKNDGEEPTDPGAAQNIGYADKLMHKYWHYIDMPFSPDGTPLIDPKVPNAKTQIEMFRDTIHAADSSEDIESYDLVWLLHLVGDVHQPLHATQRFTHALPGGDQGGNLVCLAASCKTAELHAYWDNLLGVQMGAQKLPKGTNVDAANANAAIKAAAKLAAASSDAASDNNPAHWIDESFEAAKTYAYASPVKVSGPSTLNARYKKNAKRVAMERAELAGQRLAEMLDGQLR